MYDDYNIDELKPSEVIDYLRKSRSDNPSLSVEEVLAKHEKMLDDWSMDHLGALVPEENKYREIVSGETIEDRPMIKEVLKRIESPRIKAIKVVEVQRLSRGDLEDAGKIIKLLRFTNTMVITPIKVYNLENEYDRDAFERELKRGNEYLEYQKRIMNRGRLLSVQQGNFIGNSAPYGYNKAVIMDGKKKCHTLEINEYEAEVVRMIFDMYVNQNMGKVVISNYLNSIGIKSPRGLRWSQQAIATILDNEHYIGKVRWNHRPTITVVENGEVKKTRPRINNADEFLLYDGKHEAIISDELFYAAKSKKGNNPKIKPDVKIRNPFAGLLYCQCGKAMVFKIYKDKLGNEKCAPRLMCNDQTYCKTSSAAFDEVVSSVVMILKDHINELETKLNNINDRSAINIQEAVIHKLEVRKSELEKKELQLWDKYTDEDMPKDIFEKLKDKLVQDKKDNIIALAKARESVPNIKVYEENLYKLKDALYALQNDDFSAEEQNRLLKQCFSKLEYNREKTERILRTTPRKRITVNGKRKVVSPLKSGGNWTKTSIQIEAFMKF